MYNANLLKLAFDLALRDERANSSVQGFIHSGSSATGLFHTFEKAYHNGISFDLGYVSSYNFDLQNSPP
jgi:hypothetical protein